MTQPPRRSRSAGRRFAAAAMQGDVAAAVNITSRMFATARSRTDVFTDLFDSAQRYVNELWHLGRATTFDELRVARMIEIALFAMPPPLAPPPAAPDRPAALLITLPQERHDIGLGLIGMSLEEAGWSVRLKLRVDISGIRHLIADKRFKLVGISFTYTGTDVRTQ